MGIFECFFYVFEFVFFCFQGFFGVFFYYEIVEVFQLVVGIFYVVRVSSGGQVSVVQVKLDGYDSVWCWFFGFYCGININCIGVDGFDFGIIVKVFVGIIFFRFVGIEVFLVVYLQVSDVIGFINLKVYQEIVVYVFVYGVFVFCKGLFKGYVKVEGQ